MRKFILIITILSCLTASASANGMQNAMNDFFGNEKVVFTDLNDVKWAEDAIYYLNQFGVIHHENGAVNPQRYISRKEFTELIIGSFGMYSSSAQCNFNDVDKDSFYYPYIASAYEMGIIKGISQNEFGIDGYLTRQDMATIIYRMAEKCGIDVSQKASIDFVDTVDIDDYAVDAVASLVSAGAISGNENNCFMPHSPSTFAEACKILYYIILKNT